ncbi:MAG: AzlD domain-containing protein [Noviherbaspirillum sp.]
MSASEIWLAILLLALATLITRSGLFLFGASVRLPPAVQHALRYAPAAALAAIVAPDLVLDAGGAVRLGLDNYKLLAGIGAAGFFLVTRHMLGTIVAGMGLYSLLRLVL